MRSITTTPDVPAPVGGESGLDRCEQCGRYGWHSTERCPIPAGVVRIDEWMGPAADGTDNGVRHFSGGTWVVEREDRHDIAVAVSGSQFDDGSPGGRIERTIVIDQDYDDALTVDQARRFAAALNAAADEVEQMNGYDAIEVSR